MSLVPLPVCSSGPVLQPAFALYRWADSYKGTIAAVRILNTLWHRPSPLFRHAQHHLQHPL